METDNNSIENGGEEMNGSSNHINCIVTANNTFIIAQNVNLS